jgi:peptidoglycan hydrolase-like protein with peptidoglycan-binding domain
VRTAGLPMPRAGGRMLRAVVLLGAFSGGMGAAGCAHSRNVVPPPASALPAVEVDSSGVPFAPAPEGLLRPGAVESIQTRLQAQGLLASSARSGRLDAPTREALRRFQGRKDLPATGLPSYRTIEALNLDPEKAFFSSHRQPVDPGSTSTDDKGTGTKAVGAAGASPGNIGPRDVPVPGAPPAKKK